MHGTSRDAQGAVLANLDRLGIAGQVVLHSAVATDFRSALQILERVAPDEIYALAGQSSVGLSFEQPIETMDSIAKSTLNLLEAVRVLGLDARFYHAGSGESFGDCGAPADERTAFRPRSPYALAKATAHWTVVNYRDSYGLFACSGLLFNHESPLRSPRFVTRKVVDAAVRIAAGSRERLRLGNLDIARDWGWAPEYVEAMWQMLQGPQPRDYVIATGTASPLRDFVARAFAEVDLDWRAHVDIDAALMRPSDVSHSVGDPTRAREHLGWVAGLDMPQVVRRMVAAQQSPGEPADAWLEPPAPRRSAA